MNDTLLIEIEENDLFRGNCTIEIDVICHVLKTYSIEEVTGEAYIRAIEEGEDDILIAKDARDYCATDDLIRAKIAYAYDADPDDY